MLIPTVDVLIIRNIQHLATNVKIILLNYKLMVDSSQRDKFILGLKFYLYKLLDFNQIYSLLLRVSGQFTN